MRRLLSRGGFLIPLVLSFTACSDNPVGPSPEILLVDLSLPVIAVGDTTTLQAWTTAEDGSRKPYDVKWRSLDSEIASVDRRGLVTGKRPGSVKIIAEAGSTRDTVDLSVITERYNVNVDSACEDPDFRIATVAAVGEHSIILADTANPRGGLTSADYRLIARTFDDIVHPVVTRYFGEPTDIDGNGRVLIFYTRAVNELTPPGSEGYIGGFFFARDLFPRSGSVSCPGSNEAEIFYLVVPDPTGEVNGNELDKEHIRRTTPGTIAHEYQHLINAGRRFFIHQGAENEAVWLNEGLSHIAEELVFYEASSLRPRQNIGIEQIVGRTGSERIVNAYNTYQINNLSRLHHYMRQPSHAAAYSDSASLGDRGAVWHFLRYLADRLEVDERTFWYSLVNSGRAGIENLMQVTGLTTDGLSELYHDWAITVYTDDLVGTDPIYQQPSWDNRSILEYIGLGLIEPVRLTDSAPEAFEIMGGGSAYFTFEVGPEERAEINLTGNRVSSAGDSSCSDDESGLSLEVGAVVPSEGGAARGFCIESGAEAEGYTIVVTNPSLDVTQRLNLTLTASGIRVGQPTATVAARPGVGSSRRLGIGPDLSLAQAFDLELRNRELNELGYLTGGRWGDRMRTRRSLQAMSTGPREPYLSLIRTY